MNWGAVGAMAELVGAIGVIASLLYVARQIGMNTKAMRATAHQGATSSLLDMNRLLLQGDLLEVFRLGTEDPAAVEGADKGRLAVMSNHLLRLFEGVHRQYRMGMLDQDVWEGWVRFYGDYCVAPGVQWYWAMRRDTFPDAFQDLVESLDPSQNAVRLNVIATGSTETT